MRRELGVSNPKAEMQSEWGMGVKAEYRVGRRQTGVLTDSARLGSGRTFALFHDALSIDGCRSELEDSVFPNLSPELWTVYSHLAVHSIGIMITTGKLPLRRVGNLSPYNIPCAGSGLPFGSTLESGDPSSLFGLPTAG